MPESKTQFPNLIMRASAGTGKTFQLTNRYLGLLADGRAASRILASTFTRKAAGEIVDRIVERLADAAVDEQLCAELNNHLESQQSLDSRMARRMLSRFLTQLHRVRISTLDSFFSRLARTFSLELGLSPGWSVVDELTDAALKDEAIEAVLSEDGADQVLHLLAKGEAQRSVSQLVRDTVNGLYGTYRATSKDAWQVVKRRRLADEVTIGKACEKLAGQSFEKKQLNTGVQADLQRFATQDWEKFLNTGIAKAIVHGSPTYSRATIPADLIDDYKPLIEFAGDLLVNQLVSHTEGTFKLLHVFDQHYGQLKRQQAAYRFDDVTDAVSRSVANQSYDRFAFRNDDDIDHLLLDEFQDTSPNQWAVIRRFAERTVEPHTNRSFFCVGDVKQAIYGWRGGEAEIFETVTSQLNGIQDAPPLNHSRRSSPIVIQAVNKIFQGMTRHPNLGDLEAPVRRWCEQFEEHTAESTESGWVCLEVARESDEVLDRAVERIKEVHTAAPEATIGVLTRKNKTVNRLIYLLGRHGVKASEEGGNPLTDSAAVNVVLSLLKWIDHPADTSALYHVAASPLASLLGLSNDPSKLLQFNSSHAGIELSDRLRESLLIRGYDQLCLEYARELRTHCGEREWLRLSQLVDLAAIWDERATLRPTDFVKFVETQKVAEPSSAAVRVMTVHQSKGLEFDFVVLPELDDDLTGQTPSMVSHRPGPGEPPDGVIRYANQQVRPMLPKSVQKWFEQQQSRTVSESLCVLYVAVTRAKRALLMLVPPKENERQLPRKFHGLLRAALCECAPAIPEQVMYQIGEADWYKQNASTIASAVTSEAGEVELEEGSPVQAPSWQHGFPLREGKASRGRGADLISPSAMEGGKRLSLGTALRSGVGGGFEFGTVIHRFFEQIIWIEDGVPDTEALRRELRSLGPLALTASHNDENEMFAQFIDYFHRSTSNEVVKKVLSRALRESMSDVPASVTANPSLGTHPIRLTVSNERRFVVRDGRQLLQGSIDRLVEYWAGDQRIAADIIDFKTDRSDGAEGWFEQRVAYYRPQVEAYRRAVSKWTGLENEQIRTQLLFVDPQSPRVVDLSPVDLSAVDSGDAD